MGNSPKQYTKYSKNTAEVRVKKCIPIQRGMFRLGTGNLFYLILIKIFTVLNNIVNNDELARILISNSEEEMRRGKL